ncbi:dynein light intermediate chain-domain-containing protein [Lasiosphaeria miniovina]|uniref:Dynein light intermediate chain-domain-containing protein n=1 Tax=Lasiosphaeria miniovina TaxID=1954250 RepID=A0AA40AK49_9PEZI|nr:dynein light intermediate chain-domain-containing protein [Lasiosphaeria miniovina]KAK0717353.1 dynein light intermediate chain-domain-containing protein [Lasiosphaeria miniovina]
MTANVANANRFSTYTTASTGSETRNLNNGDKKDLWSSMLDSVASGKRLPEKNLLVLGGTVDSQREFFESLSTTELRRTLDRQPSKKPPVANSFALGYTYYDVLDADQEDTLARISLYTLTSPEPAFASLLKPLLTPQSIPNTLIVVLLDWSQPWKWMRQLREWILLLRTVLVSLSDECKSTMEEAMVSWRDRGRGGGTNLDGTAVTASDGDVSLPIGPGEWEDALGLPLCLVCQNAEKMEYLEKTQGWKEEEFDVVLQFLRTILLRHGASLIYTTPSSPSQLPSLIHASLGIHSLLKKHPLKHNVIDRDKIVVPPNWDSWGKIRVLREGFDVELVSNAWALDLDQPFPAEQHVNGVVAQDGHASEAQEDHAAEAEPEGSVVSLYESAVQDPTMDALQIAGRNTYSTKLEVETSSTQNFLGQQLKILEAFRQKNDEATREESRSKPFKKVEEEEFNGYLNHPTSEPQVLDQIGPVQFNMGGIQVDADDMVKRLKDRQHYGSSPEPTSPSGESGVEDAPQMDTENLQAFFTGLMNKRPGGRNAK